MAFVSTALAPWRLPDTSFPVRASHSARRLTPRPNADASWPWRLAPTVRKDATSDVEKWGPAQLGRSLLRTCHRVMSHPRLMLSRRRK
jgi:hypothetical protein